MNSTHQDVASELRASIANLKARAEMEKFGMLAYLLGMAEQEAREIATGGGGLIDLGIKVIEARPNEQKTKVPDSIWDWLRGK